MDAITQRVPLYLTLARHERNPTALPAVGMPRLAYLCRRWRRWGAVHLLPGKTNPKEVSRESTLHKIALVHNCGIKVAHSTRRNFGRCSTKRVHLSSATFTFIVILCMLSSSWHRKFVGRVRDSTIEFIEGSIFVRTHATLMIWFIQRYCVKLLTQNFTYSVLVPS
jgi:hypothetical protein